MNNQVHPKLRPFINWFAPIDADNVKLGHKDSQDHLAAPLAGRALRALTDSTPLREAEVEAINVGGTNLESANDGEPAYIRMPELDKRVAWGDFSNASAWFETATGRTRYFCVGYEANEGRWLVIVEPTHLD